MDYGITPTTPTWRDWLWYHLRRLLKNTLFAFSAKREEEHEARGKPYHWARKFILDPFFDLLFLLFVFAGVIAKTYVQSVSKSSIFSWSSAQFIPSLVMAILVFNVIRKPLDPTQRIVPQLALAFSNGYFWTTVVGDVDVAL